jgi:hypothetical protein
MADRSKMMIDLSKVILGAITVLSSHEHMTPKRRSSHFAAYE